MKYPITAALLAATIAAPAVAQVTGPGTVMCGDYGAPADGMPEEFSQFAFLIGDYVVQFRNWDAAAGDWGEPQPFTARWNGRYGLSGRTIIDEWFDPGFGYRP
ncbi:hypothetical protein [Hyphobacterium marinum]|uniref:Uncharacterized protein n=1 Tax=Hyphobacterium marinum TaxID=3116574 RepID=A0ABU7LXC1_9PROT|nr:hypothetical protein [Hyphobacterium sp. Y6023]MEE2566180.1 hypothetical protein [Hyphobacterium sp. Y6023]